MILCGNNTNYQGDIGTPMAHLETANLLSNIFLPIINAKHMMLGIANFKIMTPIKDYEYLLINLSIIPEEIVK